jgi:hypothetical protein
MQIGEYVRARQLIDHGPHGTIKKHEPGIVISVFEDDDRQVLWVNKHRRMAEKGRPSITAEEPALLERIATPVHLFPAKQTVLAAALVGLPLVGWVASWVILPPGHHYLSGIKGSVAEEVYINHAPTHVERVVEGPEGPCLVYYARIKGRHVKELWRRELTQEQAEVELKRLNSL